MMNECGAMSVGAMMTDDDEVVMGDAGCMGGAMVVSTVVRRRWMVSVMSGRARARDKRAVGAGGAVRCRRGVNARCAVVAATMWWMVNVVRRCVDGEAATTVTMLAAGDERCREGR